MKWFFGVILMLAIALVLESGLLVYAMYVLLGLMVVSRFLARSWIENLSATRKCKRKTAEVGDTVSVAITVRNAGKIPVAWVLLEDMLPRKALMVNHPRIKVKGARIQVSKIPGKGETKVEYRLKLLMRGYYQIGPLIMETGDLFGLHRRNRVVTEPHFLMVYPKVIPLEGYDLASRRPIGEVRLTHRIYEDPTRISGVREYQPGDPQNRVHWRATARTGTLHCKVYEPSTMVGSTIVLDFHKASFPNRQEPFRSELAVTAAVSLAHSVYQMGQQIGLVTNGRDAADRISLEGWDLEYHTRQAARGQNKMKNKSDRLRPLIIETRRGVEQFQRIRETLARVELTDGLKFPEFLLEIAGRLPRDATIVAFLGHVPTETAIALGSLRRRGFAITVILILVDESELDHAFGRLMAEGIRDIRHLKNEQGLPTLCQQEVLRATPYQMATEF